MMPPGSESVPAEDSVAAIAIIVVAVIYIALFSWLAVIGWAKHRRLEREAYFRHETEKRLLESGKAGAMQILKLRTEEERIRWFRRREGLKLGGIVTTALGAGVLVGLQLIDTGDYSFAGAGGFPLIIGAAILLYAYLLYPKFSELDIDIPPIAFGDQADDPKR
jgi:hypothetical protein